MHAERIALHPTAVKVLAAVRANEENATNHLEWIADTAGVSDSTARRWLRRLDALRLVALAEDEGSGPGRKDWIWCDPHTYWEVTQHGDQVLDSLAADEEEV